ncbi:MAG: S8 family peptidase [Bdellovibrionota bacterium]
MALLLTAVFMISSSAIASEYTKGEVIVKYKTGVVRTRSVMNQFYDSLGVKKVKRFGGLMKGFEQLVFDESISVEDAVKAISQSSQVEYAQPNYILRISPIQGTDNPIPGLPGGLPCIPGLDIPGCDPNAKLPCLMPNFPPGCSDSGFPGGPGQPPTNPGNPPTEPGTPAHNAPALQPAPADVNPPQDDKDLSKAYGISKIESPDAWKITRGNNKMIVADIDTGVDYNHEDLAFNMWRNPNPTKGDVVGWDFVHNDGLPFDDNEHGSHTSGTIGAVGGNGIGVSGVAQRVSIMAVKFLSGQGSGTSADAIRSIDYAIEHGAKVLSNSWGGKGDDDNKALEEAIARARDKDVLFIAAAGNDGTDNDGNDPSFPAAFKTENIISVAATDKSDKMAFFSNYGPKTTHLAAPGVNVYSTVPGNKYASLSGTSMACPHVAGAAALLWSAHPEWNYKKVKQVLLESVDKISGMETKVSSGGRLNIAKALRRAME